MGSDLRGMGNPVAARCPRKGEIKGMGCLGPRDARDSPCQITLVTHDAMQGRTVDTVPSPKPSRVSSKAYVSAGWSVHSGGLV